MEVVYPERGTTYAEVLLLRAVVGVVVVMSGIVRGVAARLAGDGGTGGLGGASCASADGEHGGELKAWVGWKQVGFPMLPPGER